MPLTPWHSLAVPPPWLLPPRARSQVTAGMCPRGDPSRQQGPHWARHLSPEAPSQKARPDLASPLSLRKVGTVTLAQKKHRTAKAVCSFPGIPPLQG